MASLSTCHLGLWLGWQILLNLVKSLWDLQSKSVGNICIAWHKALRQMWGLASLTHGDVVSLLSDSWPLLINLKQRFIKFIHKALNHKSPVISSVAKLSIQNPSSNCGGNYCHMRYEYRMHDDVSASVTGRV